MSDCENKRKEKGLKPCPASKICNPETTRCVKRTGRVGRSILNSRRRRSKSRSKSKSKSRSKSRSKSKSKKARSKRRVRKVKSKSRRRSVRKSKIAKKSKELTKNQLPYKGDFMAAARAGDMKAMQQIRAWRTKQIMNKMGLKMQPDAQENQQQQVSEEGEGIFNKKVLNYITQEYTTIGKWLNASPENFVMEVAPPTNKAPGTWEICSIEMMRNIGRMRINPANHPGINLFSELWQSLYTIYYECPRSGNTEVNSPHLPRYYRGPQINTDPDHQFVKIGTANWVVLRPIWYPDGQIPGSRIFRLAKLRKIKGLVSNYAREGNMGLIDLLSVDHCNQKRPLQTYRLEPVGN